MTGAATTEEPSWKPADSSTVCLVLQFNDGKCAEATDVYKDVFGATASGSAMKANDMVLHQMMKIGGSSLMLSDNMMPEKAIKASSAYIYVEDVDSTCKKAQSAGFKVLQEPETMFWGDKMAITRDPYGNEWTIATVVNSNVSDEDMEKGIAELAAKAKRPREEAEASEQNKAQKTDDAPAPEAEAAKDGEGEAPTQPEAETKEADAEKPAENVEEPVKGAE